MKEGISSQGSTTLYGYTVQARTKNNSPINVNAQLFGPNWTEVKFKRSTQGTGVPVGDDLLNHFGFISFPSAKALQWWFISSNDSASYRMKTRIVKYKIELSYEISESGICSQVDGSNTGRPDDVEPIKREVESE